MFDSAFVEGMLTPILAIVGVVFGLIGTGIGLYNLWLTWRSHWVSVRVEFQCTDPSSSGDYASAETSVEVVNKSHFAISVRDVGIVYKAGLFRRVFKAQYGGNQRIDARDSFRFHAYVAPERTESHGWASNFIPAEQFENAYRVYAILSDGKRFISKKVSKQTDFLRKAIMDQETQRDR